MALSLDREPALIQRRATSGRHALAATVALAVAATSWFAAAPAATADAGDDVAAAQAAADEVAERWFAAQREAAEIDAQIERLDEQLATLRSAARTTGARARARAVTLYRSASSSGSVGTLLEGGSVMEAARRNQMLEHVNEESRAELDAYKRLVADTKASQAQLAQRHAQQRDTLARLDDEGAQLQSELARAQRAYRTEQAAAAEAQVAAASAQTAGTEPPDSTPDPTDPPTGGGEAPEPVDPPPAPQPGEHPRHNDPFLACVRQRESRGIYTAVNPSGYYGAYQFATGTWDATASHAGRPELIGVRPDRASPWDQDDLAWVLYQWQGRDPWGGSCG